MIEGYEPSPIPGYAPRKSAETTLGLPAMTSFGTKFGTETK